MKSVLYLAWRYLAFNRWKTGVLVGTITVIVFLPLALELVLDRSSEGLRVLVPRVSCNPGGWD